MMARADNDTIAKLHRDGYAVLKGFMGEPKLKQVGAELDKILGGDLSKLEQAGDRIFEKDGTTVRQLENLQNYSQFFSNLSRARRFFDLMEQLFGEEAVGRNLSYMAKAARVGSAVPYHQDNAYYYLIPDNALTFWIALDDSTEENGCVRVIPESHKKGLLPHKPSGVTGTSLCLVEDIDPERAGEVAVLLKPGDCSIHHTTTIHRSLANHSPKPRRGLLLFCRSVRCAIDAQSRALHAEARRKIHSDIHKR